MSEHHMLHGMTEIVRIGYYYRVHALWFWSLATNDNQFAAECIILEKQLFIFAHARAQTHTSHVQTRAFSRTHARTHAQTRKHRQVCTHAAADAR